MNGLDGQGGATGSTGRTRELYDAFGEVSEDEDYADENTGLTGPQPPGRSMEGIGFHSGFLNDEDPATASGVASSQEQYYDEDYSEEEEDNHSAHKAREETKPTIAQ